jgi:hypothetical protein
MRDKISDLELGSVRGNPTRDVHLRFSVWGSWVVRGGVQDIVHGSVIFCVAGVRYSVLKRAGCSWHQMVERAKR